MSPTLRLYNTLTRTKEDFVPVDPENVRMYVCGPTVYDYAHIGNARPVIVFDVLYRLLKHLAKQGVWDGGKGETRVTYARNLTDVDDKINARAARDFPGLPLNEAIAKVTQATTAQFHADIAALGCLPPDEEPRATDHIGQMQAIIHRLIARGVAYVAEEHVLFHVPAVAHLRTAPKYGALARRPLDEMIAGARVDVAPYKRDPMDFVLWKPSRDGVDPGWLWADGAPEGITRPGRPGWHIECSAMSMAKLLEPFGGGLACDDPARNVFDIHGGGIDLVFPHHENEIAQSCCAFGGAAGAPRMANYWMHNGFLQVEGEKMSKSLGNFVTINELLETETFGERRWPGQVLRLAMLKTHYRQPIDWTVKALEEARNKLRSWVASVEFASDEDTGPSLPSGFVEALADDLNFSKALAVIEASIKEGVGQRSLLAMLNLVGIDLWKFNENEWANEQASVSETQVSDEEIKDLINARLEARRAKNFAESDRIRDELAAMGIALKDGKDPVTGEPTTTWEVKR
ncbi:cysteinyl-tRNA synthetase [Bosea sp. AAP35]|uniref:cysteine--tRNA ligase n=1 Tax=Bosea sp. AAP35 TaxID=1523417 RepID=UPI0006B9E571|nr:cysteine--tRNA ligase [Bosea sp. AAP35]KPF72602.1 cysteinyl-tRNA synthetase [Bosea sp. AAP35]